MIVVGRLEMNRRVAAEARCYQNIYYTLTDEILLSSVLSYPAPYVLVAPLGRGRMGGRVARSTQSDTVHVGRRSVARFEHAALMLSEPDLPHLFYSRPTAGASAGQGRAKLGRVAAHPCRIAPSTSYLRVQNKKRTPSLRLLLFRRTCAAKHPASRPSSAGCRTALAVRRGPPIPWDLPRDRRQLRWALVCLRSRGRQGVGQR